MSAQSARNPRNEPHLSLYASHFGLREDPFRLTPDERYFFPGSAGQSLSEALQWSLVSPKGVCLLTGLAGCGKTMLLRHVIDSLPPEVPTALLWNANLGYDDFLVSVCRLLDPRRTEQHLREPAELLATICQESVQRGFHPVVVVDEAHHLPPEVLSRFQELCQIRADSRQAMAVMFAADDVGRDRLVARLGVGLVGCELPMRALRDDETIAYVLHRLRLAGCSSPVFADGALHHLQQLSGGVPRIINVLAGKALFLAYLEDQTTVTAETVVEVAKELWSGDRLRSEWKGRQITTVERLGAERHPPRVVAAMVPDQELQGSAPIEPPSSDATPQPVRARASGHGSNGAATQLAPPRQTGTRPTAVQDSWPIAEPPRQAPPPKTTPRQAPPPQALSQRAEPRRRVSPAILTALGLLLLTALLLGSQQGRDWATQSFEQMFDRYLGAGTVAPQERVRDQVVDDAQSERVPAVAMNTPDEPVGKQERPMPLATQLDTAAAAQAPNDRERDPGDVAQSEQQAMIRDLLQRAVAHVRMQQFTVPKGNNAHEDYRAVLHWEPDHPGALRGIQAIQTRLKRWARVAERRGDWHSAARYYSEALVIEPESEKLAAALRRVQAKLSVLQSSEANAGAGAGL